MRSVNRDGPPPRNPDVASPGPAAATPNASLVSAVIPCFNGERYLAEAIDSVLVQSVQPLEVIVVDDGSTDRSRDIAARFGAAVRLQAYPHAGISATRNRGLACARGGFIAFLDADDLWLPDKLAVQMDAFEKEPHLEMVGGAVEVFVTPDPAKAFTAHNSPVPARLCARAAGATVIRRSALARVGGFDTRLRTGEWIDWCARAQELGIPSRLLPDVVLKRRIHASNHGRRQPEARSDYLRVVKAALDRRRSTSPANGEPMR